MRAIALYLSEQFIPKDRLSEVMEDVFGLAISDTTLIKYESLVASNTENFHSQLSSYMKAVRVKHADETSVRSAGKTHWIHVLSNEIATYLRYSPSRKTELSNVLGTVIHDHYSSYTKSEHGFNHAFCNAHHLRELKALVVHEKEEWAMQMHTFLRIMGKAKHNKELSLRKIQHFERVFMRLAERGVYHHEKLPEIVGARKNKRRPGHNLALRLIKHSQSVLRFLRDEAVDFTNNQAERDLRMVKLKGKVSGCFRTSSGAHNFSVIRSLIGTVRKNGLNVLELLKQASREEISLASILPLSAFNHHPLLLLPYCGAP